jgi:hypothetical protein
VGLGGGPGQPYSRSHTDRCGCKRTSHARRSMVPNLPSRADPCRTACAPNGHQQLLVTTLHFLTSPPRRPPPDAHGNPRTAFSITNQEQNKQRTGYTASERLLPAYSSNASSSPLRPDSAGPPRTCQPPTVGGGNPTLTRKEFLSGSILGWAWGNGWTPQLGVQPGTFVQRSHSIEGKIGEREKGTRRGFEPSTLSPKTIAHSSAIPAPSHRLPALPHHSSSGMRGIP